MAGPGIATIMSFGNFLRRWHLLVAKKTGPRNCPGALSNVQCAGMRAGQITAYAAF